MRGELRRAPRRIGAHLSLGRLGRGRIVGVASRVDVVVGVHILEPILSGGESVEPGGVVWCLLLARFIGP